MTGEILQEIENNRRLGGDDSQLRRFGIYSQRPREDGFYMVRIRIPGGEVTSHQLRTIGELANLHGRGLADVTVRQNVQLHWVKPDSLPELLGRLDAAGLSTTEPCSRALRNIVTCPVSGVDENELYDARGLVSAINRLFETDGEFSALPRKLKVTVTGCALRCVYPEVNDIGIFAVPDFERGGIAFRARVGGGLSTKPRFSQDLGILAGADEVPELCLAIGAVFRDRSDRDDLRGSREKYLIWPSEVESFRAALESKLGRVLRRSRFAEAAPVAQRDRSHVGIHGQKVAGLYYIGLPLLGGRTSGDGLRRLADLAEESGSGRLRTTNTQGIALIDVPEWNLEAVSRELELAGFDYEPSWPRRGLIACSGVQFCNLARAETKGRAARVASYLEQAVALDEAVRISITGCANACGQHHICDVGLEGTNLTTDGVAKEAFHLLVGGGVGRHETLSRRIGVTLGSEEVGEALGRLFASYKERRLEAESFQEFCMRHGDGELAEMILGESSGELGGGFGGALSPRTAKSHTVPRLLQDTVDCPL